MTIGLIGRKAGMTRVFTDAGESIPVTVIEALPNRVTQVKAVESDGYRAVQVAFGDRKPSRLPRALARARDGDDLRGDVKAGQRLAFDEQRGVSRFGHECSGGGTGRTASDDDDVVLILHDSPLEAWVESGGG